VKPKDGPTAGREFIRITFGNVTGEERAKVGRQLQAYCRQDTHYNNYSDVFAQEIFGRADFAKSLT
jgi:hypothetical protein